MDGPAADPGAYLFGPFLLDPVGRTLTRDATRVPLPARLFDTLLYLVENHGRVVARDELTRAVWPGRVIEEGNLAKAVSSLRIALKSGGLTEDIIVTAHGRGYRFAAPVQRGRRTALPEAASPAPAAQPPPTRRIAAWLAPGLALACAALWLVLPARRDAPAPFAPPPRSVAVLPFANAGGDPADEQFSDGVSEELINALGRVRALRVAGRLSSFSFKGRQAGLADIARQLNVATILEGSVRREGEHLRVRAQLLDAANGYQLWAQEYDLDRKDVLSMEGRIAEAVIASLKIVLGAGDAALLTLGGTQDPVALDAYLTGMASLVQADEDTNPTALAAFTRAIARDPNYAQAYAQRARALAYEAATGRLPDAASRQHAFAMARQDAARAVALAPDLGAGHAALALVLKLSLSNFAQAQQELRRAMALSPGDVATLMDGGFFALDLGHPADAVAAAQHAVALDPLTPRTYKMLAEVLAFARRFDEAFLALRHAATLRPADADNDRVYLAIVQQLQGDAAAARRTCAAARDYYDLACLAWADQKLGRQAEAQAALTRLHALAGDDGAYLYARIAAQWGRPAEALHWLQVAYDTHDAGLLAIRIDPFLDALRDTPDYRRIEQGMGFP